MSVVCLAICDAAELQTIAAGSVSITEINCGQACRPSLVSPWSNQLPLKLETDTDRAERSLGEKSRRSNVSCETMSDYFNEMSWFNHGDARNMH